MSRQTPVERLCELLDDAGIKHSKVSRNMVKWGRDGLTFSASNAWPRNDSTRMRLVAHVVYPTPEQAAAMTVGTSHMTANDVFGEMRHSTPEEQEAFEKVLECMSFSLVPQEEVDRLKSVNAKLRGLLARADRARRDLCDAYPDADMLTCEECPAWGSCKGDIADSMRELGIEVRDDS